MVLRSKFLPVFCLLITSAAGANTVLFCEDFETGENSVVYKYLKAHGHDVKVTSKIGVNSSKGLEVQYDSLYKGSVRVKGFFNLAKKVSEATLSYDVRFSEDFQFKLGGKLHGLGPDQVVTGDWKRIPNGWSARVMWRENGKIETVLVLQDQTNKWGVYKGNESFHFTRGKYYAVTFYVRLNTAPNKKDGEARIYVDGKLLVKYDNAFFWSDPANDSKISQFLFSTFHGGGTSAWAPKDRNGNYLNVHATFDNFLVTEGLEVREKAGESSSTCERRK